MIWAILIAAAVFLYVVLDGFDLGLGILFPAVRGKAERDLMVNTVAPVWDGATVLPALYMPLILMLLALIFRGVASKCASATPRTVHSAFAPAGSECHHRGDKPSQRRSRHAEGTRDTRAARKAGT